MGFGSCHSFGVAVVPIAIGMPAMACAPDNNRDVGKFGAQFFLKMPRVMRDKLRVGHYFSDLSNFNYFFKVQVIPKPLTCPRGKSLLVECHPLDD